MTEKAAAARSLGRMEHILNRFWKAVSDFLHIHFTSAENVADRPLKDLLDGIDPRVYIKGDKRIGNGKSVDVLPLREQRGQQTSETRFIDPLLLKAKTDGNGIPRSTWKRTYIKNTAPYWQPPRDCCFR